MDGEALDRLKEFFPRLDSHRDRVTSDATDGYNCVAWAAGENHRWWERVSWRPTYWPPGLLDDETPAGWVKLFQDLGYTACEDESLEPGFEKIAIYVRPDWKTATHVARQLPGGPWTSKLGALEDIEHSTLETLAGEEYGVIGIILKRPISNPD
jgi:hypothetical protein